MESAETQLTVGTCIHSCAFTTHGDCLITNRKHDWLNEGDVVYTSSYVSIIQFSVI